MELEDIKLTEQEIQTLLKKVNDRLEAEMMAADNISGRTITVSNEDGKKRSGGIMVSKKEGVESDYLGTFYSFEEFMTSLNDYIGRKEVKMSTFKRTVRLEVDQDSVDEALQEFTSLFVEKLETARKTSADFYVVSRSDRDSDDEKRTGGLITPSGMEVEEGRYIDVDTARNISLKGTVEELEKEPPKRVTPPKHPVPPKHPLPPLYPPRGASSVYSQKGREVVRKAPVYPNISRAAVVENMPEKKTFIERIKEAIQTFKEKRALRKMAKDLAKAEPVKSTFKRKELSKEEERALKDIITALGSIALATILVLAIRAFPNIEIGPDFELPDIPGIEFIAEGEEEPIIDISDIDENVVPPPIKLIEETVDDLISSVDDQHTLEIGDIVEMHDGESYDHTSQRVDGISGEIGTNPYREAGDYTVDVIAVLDGETNEIIATTTEPNANIEDLLLANGYSQEDIDSGKIVVRYNVSEGKNVDLNGEESAGWVTYDKDDYKDREKGNIIQEMLSEQTDNIDEQVDIIK